MNGWNGAPGRNRTYNLMVRSQENREHQAQRGFHPNLIHGWKIMFEQFIRERQFLHNVTPLTIVWYENRLRWLPCESPTQAQLNDVVMRMREKGLKATACNSTIQAINAYLHWHSGNEGKCGAGCRHLRVRQLKTPQFIPSTFTEVQIKRIVNWKPKGKYQRRLHLLVLFLADTGCRISEALTLRVREIDLDNLLVTLDGKGRKQRVVPFSFELRKALFRYCKEFNRTADKLLFANNTEMELIRCGVRLSVKLLCKRLGFDAPARTLHAFRHSFAINYLRKGGSVFHLQKVLGHSTLEMTRRYSNLLTADLQAVHQRISLLVA
jgi:integrase/recombinase XerD